MVEFDPNKTGKVGEEPSVPYGYENDLMDDLFEKYPQIASEFQRVQREQFELFARKMMDYGRGNIALGGDLTQEEDKQFALTGLTIRMNDKINRLKNLVKNQGKAYVDESMEDTFIDLSNYGIIALLLQRDKW